MIDVKTAVRKGLQYVRDVYEGVELRNLALEEVRLSDDEQWWLVTVGFQTLGEYRVVQSKNTPLLFPAQSRLERLPRDLKLVKINATTGEPAPDLIDRSLSEAG